MERSGDLVESTIVETEIESSGGKTKESKEVDDWIRIGISVGIAASLHPFDYAKTLIQLGHEPLEAQPGRTFFGKPVMFLPNIFQYTAYLRKVDGITGCYAALTPKLMCVIVSKLASRKMASKFGLVQDAVYQRVDIGLSDREALMEFKQSLQGDIILCLAGVVASHPFHVIYIRTMAQFVGRENLYSNIITAVKEIYQTEGFKGFFNGLAPRIIWDLGCLILTGTTVFLVDRFIFKEKMKKQYTIGVVQYLFTNILYPLQVSSTCMAVSGSRLMAGQPPMMPPYKHWIDCLGDLSRKGELKRGNSSLLRFIPAPGLNGVSNKTKYV